jgi:excisionase family DNA binding protein
MNHRTSLRTSDPPDAIGDDRKLVLTISEAAILLRISRGHAYELARRNELPVIRLGRRIVVPRRALDDYLLGRIDDLQAR